MTKFKVGDKVRHVSRGKGKVIQVDECDCFQPYFVEFHDCIRWSTENNLTLRESKSKYIPVSDEKPTENCIVKVKLLDGTRTVAFYITDFIIGTWLINGEDGKMHPEVTASRVVSWKPFKTKKEQA